MGRFQSDNGEGLIQAAEAGLGVAALPDFIVSDSIQAGRLVPLLTNYSLQEGAIYVGRPPGRVVAAKIRAFVDVVVEHVRGDCANKNTTVGPKRRYVLCRLPA